MQMDALRQLDRGGPLAAVHELLSHPGGCGECSGADAGLYRVVHNDVDDRAAAVAPWR
ncbi:MAG: hypothetical protein ACLU38_05430 [Dysosmobacter sp.]